MILSLQKPISLSFAVSPAAMQEAEGKYKIAISEKTLCVSLFYEGHDTPILLKADAAKGDEIMLVVRDYRVELWVNGVLADEDWPWGAPLFDGISLPDGVFSVGNAPAEPELPAVVSTFENAEGWMPGGGVFVGDCMPYTSSGRYHVLYLKDRRHHQSKWRRGAHQWEHISTDDFLHWQIHPMAVPIDRAWEGSICTGSHTEKDGKHYLFYSIRTVDGSPAPICRSVSEDGYHFQKDLSFSFTLSEKYHQASARDPKLVRDENGLFHMFVTSSLMSMGKGCLVHLTSEDLDSWKEEDEPIFISDTEEQPECPDYFAFGGYYYLVFSLRGVGQYRISQKPFSDFRMPKAPVIPCESVPKGAVWGDKIVFAGFRRIEGYAGTMTFAEAVPDQFGELDFSK